jgi:hypothetical protein
MKSMITPNPLSSLSLLPIDPAERRAQDKDRMARLAVLDPEQLPLALAFLAGYLPFAFDAALEAAEPPMGEREQELEPFCTKCGVRVGEFLAHGPGYRHYRGVVTATSKPRPYKADHRVALGWRPAADIPARRDKIRVLH